MLAEEERTSLIMNEWHHREVTHWGSDMFRQQILIAAGRLLHQQHTVANTFIRRSMGASETFVFDVAIVISTLK